MKTIAIIPARGGSKRIPRKNIREFLGKPIIAYSIEAALKSELFNEVMVSTDDEEIAALSRQYGASIPFMRSPETSDDFASTADVLLEVLEQYGQSGSAYEYCCCIYPTAPFVTASKLIEAMKLLKEKNFDSLFPVSQFSYPIQRALNFADGRVRMIAPENMRKRSQDLEPAYHDAGQFYFLRVSSFLKEKILFMPNSGAIILNDLEAQDIDNETDWKVAEIKFKMLHFI